MSWMLRLRRSAHAVLWKVFRWSGYFKGADRLHLPYEEQEAGLDGGAGLVDRPTQANGVADALQHVSLNKG